MHIESLLDHTNKLPTIPRVAQQIITSFGNPNVTVADIARQLATDPALSAKVLQLANSSYFHVSRSIGTLDDALKLLGLNMVRNLVLSNSMVSAYRGTSGMDLRLFWRYNLYTACAARWLARQFDTNADAVFTLGLMHAIGQLQMHVAVPVAMVSLDKAVHVLESTRAIREREALSFHYGEVSAQLAQAWQFPSELVQDLRDIPLADALPSVSRSAACVHIAAGMARADVLRAAADHPPAAYPVALGVRLGLGPLPEGALPMPALHALTEGLDDLIV
jgi:HD-like signal output (HDOD) protein